MRSLVLSLAVVGLLPGTMARTLHEVLQMHKRTAEGLAPLYRHDNSSGAVIPDEYFVMFQPGWTPEQHWAAVGGKDKVVDARDTQFQEGSLGYSAKIVDDRRMDRIRADPGVLLVESNLRQWLVEPVDKHGYHPGNGNDDDYDDDDDAELKGQKLHKLGKREYTEEHEHDAPWGLQVLNNGGGKLKTPIQDNGQYDFLHLAGFGVQVYVLDTGIRITHQRFQGRARNFGDLAPTAKSPYCNDGSTMDDIDGHGTHVAGTIGAQKYGVAPDASLINVKVLCNNGRGNNQKILQAVQDVTTEHIANKAKKGATWGWRGSVINMSLSHPGISYTEVIVYLRAKEAGVTVFAAAGNQGIDAANQSPCAYPEVRCVGAVDRNYTFSWYSNYGHVLQYLAPGSDILSLGIKDDTALDLMSGTSMASPHAAGAAAIFTSWQGLISDNSNPNGYVYWNSIDGQISGVPSGTSTLLINTGIHSPKKYPNEPFRWAGDYPVKNHEANYLANISQDGSGTPLPGEALTGDDLLPEYRTMGIVDLPQLNDGPVPTVVKSDYWPDITGFSSDSSTPTDPAHPPFGQCKEVSDCMPGIICTGHSVNKCQDGKCICDAPSSEPPAAMCASDNDCNDKLQCLKGSVVKCDEAKQCNCNVAPSPTATSAPQPKPTCNLHLWEHSNSWDAPITVQWKLSRSDKSWSGTWTQHWDEEHIISQPDVELSGPISITLTSDLPPGVVDEDCPEPRHGGHPVVKKRCAMTQWKSWLIALKYADLAWDSRYGQDLSKTPHCQVGAWDEGFVGVVVDRNRQMDCRFVC